MCKRNKTICCLFFSFCVLLSGCTADLPPFDSNATLIVNGQDITEGNYVRIDYEKQEYELPLVAVLEALGAEIQWISNFEATVVFDNTTYYLDIKKVELIHSERNANVISVVPGATGGGYYQVIEKEIILNSSRIAYLLSKHGMWVSVDYNEAVITIYPKPNIS